MRVAIYARVSTANNGQDPTMQTRELREYAERRGWTVTGEYVDIGISGTKEKRPELDQLMADAHRPAVRCRCSLEVRSLRAIGEPSTASSRRLQGSGHRICFFLRAVGYQHAHGQIGLYGSRSRRGVRALAHRRTREGRVAECACQGKAAWTTARNCGPRQNSPFSRAGRFLGNDSQTDGGEQGNGSARVL
jgi:hypothetical protein